MKRYILLLLAIPLFFGCDNDTFSNRNPYIPNYDFAKQFNLNLPSYSQLQFPGNSIYYGGSDAGARGLILFNAGGNNFIAYDGACPNQEISACSTMEESGSVATCPCDGAIYNLFTGRAEGLQYPMKAYRVEVNLPIINVYN